MSADFLSASRTPKYFNLQGTAACCGGQLRLDPPSLLAENKPFVGASGDTISVGQVSIAIPCEKPQPEQQQQQQQH